MSSDFMKRLRATMKDRLSPEDYGSYKRLRRGFVLGVVAVIVGWSIVLLMWGGILYVLYHFITKYW